MSRRALALLMLGLMSHACFAGAGEDQAKSFANLYASLCLRNVANLDALREKQKSAPKLAPDKAATFLAGKPGDAWALDDKQGSFVLVLPGGRNLCAVHGRKANVEEATKLFKGLVANAPAPALARQVRNEQGQSAANGKTQTISYEWSDPKSTRKMLFTLTTAASSAAQVQVIGEAEFVSQ